MDITDILSSPKQEPPSGGSLLHLAHAAAQAKDQLDGASCAYTQLYEQLLRDVDREVQHLRENLERAKAAFEAITAELTTAMQEAKVDAIPLDDRPPIELKVIHGRKKIPTKSFLVEQLGRATAETIWQRLPNNPDKLKVEVPSATPPSD